MLFHIIKIYKNLLALDPHHGSWWFGLGVSLDKLGKKNEAISAYTQALHEGQLAVASLDYLQKRIRTLQEVGNEKE